MFVSAAIHCDTEENIKFELTDIKNSSSGGSYRVLEIGNNANIFLNEGQAEKLCEVLEEALYDEPTYKQLADENSELRTKIDELNEVLKALEECIEFSKKHR